MSVKFNDVSNAICKLLKTNFPTHSIYTEEVIQKLKRPSFHMPTVNKTLNDLASTYRLSLLIPPWITCFIISKMY